jgi:hypothetical protein
MAWADEELLAAREKLLQEFEDVTAVMTPVLQSA